MIFNDSHHAVKIDPCLLISVVRNKSEKFETPRSPYVNDALQNWQFIRHKENCESKNHIIMMQMHNHIDVLSILRILNKDVICRHCTSEHAPKFSLRLHSNNVRWAHSVRPLLSNNNWQKWQHSSNVRHLRPIDTKGLYYSFIRWVPSAWEVDGRAMDIEEHNRTGQEIFRATFVSWRFRLVA